MSYNSTILFASAVGGSTVALYSSGMFFCASQLVLPATYRLPASSAVAFFEDFYRRGASTQVPMGIASAVANSVAAVLDPGRRMQYAAAAALSAGTIIWTVGVMMATNMRLLQIAKEGTVEGPTGKATSAEPEVTALLKRWKRMNNIRAALTAAAGAVGLTALLRN